MNRRWVLKSPDHVYALDKLLTVFPEAVIIQTHRNPLDVLKSQIRLTQVLEAMFARPRQQLATSEARKIEQMLGYITGFRDAYPSVAGKIIDVTYRELVSDPMAVVHRIYERLDIRLTEVVAERMRRLAAARFQYNKGRRDGQLLVDPGLHSPLQLQGLQDYCSRFGIPWSQQL